jgi:small nuclear ribonucleoprotein D3
MENEKPSFLIIHSMFDSYIFVYIVFSSSSQKMVVGVPVKLLHESQGHVVTVELKTGGIYRGKLINVEDNMNVQLKDITFTDRDGQVRKMEQIYVRGSHIRYFIVPDMLKNAPMFSNVGQKGKGIGLSKGKATVMKAQKQKGRVTGPSRTVA